ncbi:MAG: hypothetical protein HYU02_07555 [Thaumarchaeota archaeon]|nr:hypothetical protein [Nitrososphaerota archaeon]
MTQAADLTAREAEIIRIVRVLGLHLGRFVVVGGYAVNALAAHRFSVDCDIIIAKKDIGLFEIILREEGYKKVKATRKIKGFSGKQTKEYSKLIGNRRVSVDLFANSVTCRQTNGEWSYSLIRKNSIEANVVGLTESTVTFVPKRELLMAMKIHSGRDTDLRDVIMLSEGADWQVVAKFATCGVQKKVIEQLIALIETISKEEFPSALRAEFSLTTDVTPLIRRTTEGLQIVRKLLSASP